MCEEGTYSLADPATTSLADLSQKVCLPCPDGAAGCYGDTIELDEGYWRISDIATRPLRCPLTKSCIGGTGSGDDLCANGYECIYNPKDCKEIGLS